MPAFNAWNVDIVTLDYEKTNQGSVFMLFKHFAAATVCSFALSSSATAQTNEIEELAQAIGLSPVLEVMREEGLIYADDIAENLLQTSRSSEWDALVDRLYDTADMRERVVATLAAEIEPDNLTLIVDFFQTEPGESLIAYEVAAREAFLDKAVEEAANDVAALAAVEKTDRYQLVTEFIEANDLIETNIVGALNASYAFYQGMQGGGGFPAELTEDQMLQDVWSQEPEIRSSTTEWVYSFLMLAYEPVEDADLEAYIAFSETDAGQDYNSAMFTAFDGMYNDISRGLGLAAAQVMQQQEL